MARNEELLNNLRYVYGLMERFAALAAACDESGPIPVYSSLGDYRAKTAKTQEDKRRARWIGDDVELPLSLFIEDDFSREDELAEKRDRRELTPKAIPVPQKPAKPKILLSEKPFFYQVSKKQEYERALRDYERQLAEYERVRGRIGALKRKQREMVEMEVKRRSRQRYELAKERWEAKSRAEHARIRTEMQCYERESARIDRENEARKQQLINNIAEMQAAQCLFDDAISNGWYPPAFKNLDACKYFIFAVENQLVHNEEELARVYIEKLRHDELINTIDEHGRTIAAACESIRLSIENSTQRVTSAIRDNADLLRNELSMGNMAILDSISQSADSLENRIKSEGDTLYQLYVFDRFMDGVFSQRRESIY